MSKKWNLIDLVILNLLYRSETDAQKVSSSQVVQGQGASLVFKVEAACF